MLTIFTFCGDEGKATKINCVYMFMLIILKIILTRHLLSKINNNLWIFTHNYVQLHYVIFPFLNKCVPG